MFGLFCFEQIEKLFFIFWFECFVCMYVCITCVPGAQRREKKALNTLERITNGCGLPCECRELNPEPLEEQSALKNL